MDELINSKDTEEFTVDATFTQLAIKHHGNIAAIARALGKDTSTLYSWFKTNPDAKRLIDYVREYNDNYFLDLAEKVVNSNLQNWREKPALAQKAAELVINKKGHRRGWEGGEDKNPVVNEQVMNNFNSLIDQLNDYRSSLKIDTSKSIKEAKS